MKPLQYASLALVLALASTRCSDSDPLDITPSAIPAATVGDNYSVTLRVEGELGNVTWSIPFGDLPAGVGIPDDARGASVVLSGSPAELGLFNFTVRAEGDEGTIQKSYVLNVQGIQDPLRITTQSLPTGLVGVPYDGLIGATGGANTGYRWEASNLPPGVQIEEFGTPSIRVFGTPNQAGTFDLQVTVFDPNGDSAQTNIPLQIRDQGQTLRIVTETLAPARLGQPYETTIEVEGGPGGNYVWFPPSGLPAGIRFEGNTGSATARLFGTPSVAGGFPIDITVVDGDANALAFYTLTVRVPDPLTIRTRSLPPGATGVPYSAELVAVGGVQPYTWTFDPELPAGLSLVRTGTVTTIEGTPEVSGVFDLLTEVTDNLDDTRTVTLRLAISAGPPAIVPSSLPAGEAGVAYTATVLAEDGDGTYNWSVTSGALPDGLSIEQGDANPVVISGIPTTAGSFPFTLAVTDGAGIRDQENFQIEVAPAADPIRITTTSVPDGVVTETYVAEIMSEGGTGMNIQWTVNDPLPDGLITTPVNGGNLLVFGTPTAEGTTQVSFTVTDGITTDSQTLGFTVTSSVGTGG